MTLGSLFAGIGGFDLGFEREGFKCIWQVERDPHCRKLLDARFPAAAIEDDVCTFHPAYYDCPDVLTFGFPCQDLSVAGQRNGLEGQRSGLFYEATRIIARFVPRGLQFAVAENVPGIFSSNDGRDFARVIGTLGQCGALDIAWATLDSQWFGLAQRRKRVFIVADFRGQRAGEILSLAESLCWHPAPSRETRERIAPTIEGRAGRSGENNFATSGGLACSLRVQPNASHRADSDTYVTHALRSEGADASEDGTGRGTPLVPDVAWALQERDSKGSDSSTKDGHLIPIAFSSKDSGADAGHLAPTLRACPHDKSHQNGGAPPAIAFTERTRADGRNFETQEEMAYALTNPGSGGRTHSRSIIANGVRRLTPIECERLQGFPDNWTAGFSDSTRYRMLGNAVSVPVAQWIARQINCFNFFI